MSWDNPYPNDPRRRPIGSTGPEVASERIIGDNIPWCQIKGCLHVSASIIFLTVPAEWESGRQLQGRIRQPLSICEEHFEKLVDGMPLEAKERPIH